MIALPAEEEEEDDDDDDDDDVVPGVVFSGVGPRHTAAVLKAAAGLVGDGDVSDGVDAGIVEVGEVVGMSG